MGGVSTLPECPVLALRPSPIWLSHPHLFFWTLGLLFEEVVFIVYCVRILFSLSDLLASTLANSLVCHYPGLLTVMCVRVFILMYMYISPSTEKSIIFTYNSSY